MASTSYLNKKRKEASARNSQRGILGNKVKARLRMERGSDLVVVGGMTTWGSMGEHTIELLACDDPTHVWIRVDGELRQPRTMRGFFSVLNKWAWQCLNN